MKHLFMSLIVASASMSAVAQDIQMMNTPVLSGVVAKAKPQIEANDRFFLLSRDVEAFHWLQG